MSDRRVDPATPGLAALIEAMRLEQARIYGRTLREVEQARLDAVVERRRAAVEIASWDENASAVLPFRRRAS